MKPLRSIYVRGIQTRAQRGESVAEIAEAEGIREERVREYWPADVKEPGKRGRPKKIEPEAEVDPPSDTEADDAPEEVDEDGDQ